LYIAFYQRFACYLLAEFDNGFRSKPPLRKTNLMEKKSRQSKTEEEKTVSLKITGLRKLRFEVLEPTNGIIDIVNALDNGRVCSLRIEDFNSLGDAQAYAEVIRVAPELLNHYLGNAKTVKEVEIRMKKEIAKTKGEKNKKNKDEK
jgi:hypothetical protein